MNVLPHFFFGAAVVAAGLAEAAGLAVVAAAVGFAEAMGLATGFTGPGVTAIADVGVSVNSRV